MRNTINYTKEDGFFESGYSGKTKTINFYKNNILLFEFSSDAFMSERPILDPSDSEINDYLCAILDKFLLNEK